MTDRTESSQRTTQIEIEYDPDECSREEILDYIHESVHMVDYVEVPEIYDD